MTTRRKFGRRMRRFVIPMWVGLFVVAIGAIAMDRAGQAAMAIFIPMAGRFSDPEHRVAVVRVPLPGS